MELLFASNQQTWRKWLKKNSSTESEVWLVFYKKHTGIQGVSYEEAVNEALCFGWIDSVKKRIDEERYCFKFTPRRRDSVWSASNLKRIEQLAKENRIKPSGWKVIGSIEEVRTKVKQSEVKVPDALPDDLEVILKTSPSAWREFNGLAPSYKKNYIHWITSARREETRIKRLREAIQYLERGKKLPLK